MILSLFLKVLIISLLLSYGGIYLNQDILIFFNKLQHAWLDPLVTLFTFMGNEEFYFIILPLVYLCFSKTHGFRLAYIFLFSIYINTVLKLSTAVTRPINVEGVNSIHIGSADTTAHFPHDSFPSGHAQGSATLWGYLAYMINRPVFWVISILFISCISLSRLYTGLHWPTDIAAGIMIAIVILLLGVRIANLVAKLPISWKWGLAIAFPIALSFAYPEADAVKYAGFLLGAGVAYLLEQKYVGFTYPAQWFKRAAAYLIALVSLFGFQIGIKALLPEMLIADFLRYGFLGIWGFLIYPYILVVIGLYGKDGITKAKIDNPNLTS